MVAPYLFGPQATCIRAKKKALNSSADMVQQSWWKEIKGHPHTDDTAKLLSEPMVHRTYILPPFYNFCLNLSKMDVFILKNV